MQRINHDERTSVQVMNDMIQETGRCGFECQNEFKKTLMKPNQPKKTISNEIPKKFQTEFQTTFKTPLQIDLKIESASKNVAGMRSYAPPCEQEFRHVPPIDGDFQTKFTIPSNQDLRRQIARDQEGFLTGNSIKEITCERYDPKRDGKKDFHLQLPNTSSKTGNLNLRLQITLDQTNLFQGGIPIDQHKYRNENHEENRFLLEFKPTGKGYGCVDIGNK